MIDNSDDSRLMDAHRRASKLALRLAYRLTAILNSPADASSTLITAGSIVFRDTFGVEKTVEYLREYADLVEADGSPRVH